MPEWHGQWDSDSRRYLAATTIMMVLSTVTFMLRLLSRRQSGTHLWWDDLCAGVALLLSYGPNLSTVYSIHFGLGHHQSEVGEANAVKTLEVNAAHLDLGPHTLSQRPQDCMDRTGDMATCNAIHQVLALAVLSSTLSKPVAPPTSQFIGAFVLAWMISTTIVQINACTPVAYYWNRAIPGGHCLNYDKFYIITGAINMATDAIVLGLPLPVVWSLKVSRNRKIGLSFAFALGGFACIASIVRMALLPKLNPMDITYSAVNVGIWACVEVSAGVISCNIPATAPLFVNLMRKLRPQDPKSLEPRGYALPPSLRGRYNKFGKYGRNKYRYGRDAGFSTGGFSTINDYEANADTVELAITAKPIAPDKSDLWTPQKVLSEEIDVVC